MIQAPSTRGKARSFTFVVCVVTAVGVAAACTPSPRANGESCLKNDDCLSGVCTSSVCVSAPTILDAEVSGDGSLLDSSTAGDGSTGSETSTPGDSGTAADSGTTTAHDSGSPEASATDSGSADSATE